MSAYIKDIVREIKNSFGRFISLFIITALGAASMVGIQATTIDMRDIADKYYKSSSLYDLQIKSTTGFSGDDVSALANADGVSVVMPTYIYDVFAYYGGEVRTARTYALPDTLNKVELLSGRLPENAGECAVEERVLRESGLEIGDTLRLGRDDMSAYHEVFDNEIFTIVGVIYSPFYITHERGNTTIGDGALNCCLYLHPSAYKLDVYTDVYLLMNGSQEMYNLSDEYYERLDEWEVQIQPSGDERIKLSEDKLSDARRELDDGWVEYNNGVIELEEKVADGRKELADAELELIDALKKLENGQAELDTKIADAKNEIDRNQKELNDGQAELDIKLADLLAGQEQLDMALSQLRVGLFQLESVAPRGVSPELDAQYAQLDAGLAEASAKQSELDAGRAAIDEAQKTLNSGAAKLKDARRELETERVKAQAEIADGWTAYNDGLRDYNDGLATLEKEEADARRELADAKAELEDAEDKLDGAPKPEWFYFTRRVGVAYDSYYQDTLRLEKIGYVFPLVFFLVAIMVSLTSMSRMVEERRTQIGLYKALGYRPSAILMKYLIYSALASVGGGILGVFAGSAVFPRVISDAYGHLYNMPPVETPVPPLIGAVAVIAAAAAIISVTLATCMGSMREAPARLMRPKPPAAGKRVLMERIPFIWNRLSFIGKVTSRNIFRYKRRFFMTLIGIAGCSALLLTAFGLRDGVGGVVDMQYNHIVKYDTRAYLKEVTTNEQREELNAAFTGKYMYIRDETVDAEGVSGGLSAQIIVPEKPEELGEYINLRLRTGGKSITLADNGIIVTEKLARVMGVSAGDSFTMISGDGKSYTAVVSGISENYVMHYIYMAPKAYEQIFSEFPYPNGAFAFTEDEQGLASSLLNNGDVHAVVHTSEMLTNLSDATDALSIVTVVLIILACALAMIVLFNLTNINITERIRELATIKVLGFYNGEVSMYVYRENAAVTALGIAVGMAGGILLHGFVLSSAEIDLLMFPHTIKLVSYIYSVALAAAFAVFVNLVMNIKLARINMVESLKNVE